MALGLRTLTADDRLHWLRWIAILVPPCALLLVEVLNHQLLGEARVGVLATVVACGVALVVAYVVASFAFGALDDARTRTIARAREVEALDALVRERERLSRELHDGTAQLLAYVLMRTETVGQLVAAARRDDALSELEQLRVMADDLYVDVRETISGLRTRVVEQGLAPAVREYAADFAERHDLDISIDIDDALHVQPLVAFHLFRVVQEALANVRKHADAHQIRVELHRLSSTLILTVADDGRGFDPGALHAAEGEAIVRRDRFGLETMRERAAVLGGVFSLESQPGRGTRVSVAMPIESR
jgi:two-component system nitrate/nitrite sensor histidine kinase NarX